MEKTVTTSQLMTEYHLMRADYENELYDHKLLNKKYNNLQKKLKITLLFTLICLLVLVFLDLNIKRSGTYVDNVESRVQELNISNLEYKLIGLFFPKVEPGEYSPGYVIVYSMGYPMVVWGLLFSLILDLSNFWTYWLNSGSDLAYYVIHKWKLRPLIVKLEESNMRLKKYEKQRKEMEQILLERGVKEEYLDKI